MNRRHFLGLLGASPLVARSYFDMGAAWQRHGRLWAPAIRVGDLVAFGLNPLRTGFTQDASGRVFVSPAYMEALDTIRDIPPTARDGFGVYAGDGRAQVFDWHRVANQIGVYVGNGCVQVVEHLLT